MQRSIIFSGEQPRTFDHLWAWKDTLTGLGDLMVSLAGNNAAVVSGLVATATGPASLSINIAKGWIYQQAPIDAAPYGSLASDPTLIQQQGFAIAQQVALTTSGLSSGQSQWALVQAQFAPVDIVRPGDPTGGLLFYFNSANPTVPFQGPGGNGQVQSTMRQGTIAIQVVYGSPATTGSEVPPNATAGWVPLYLVDLTFGQTQITGGQILTAGPSVGTGVPSNYPYAPFIGGLLRQHHTGHGTGQAPQIDLTAEVQGVLPLPNLPSSSTTGGGVPVLKLFAGNPNTHVAGSFNVNGAADLCWDSTNKVLYLCTVTGNAAAAVWSAVVGQSTSQFAGGTSTGSANAQVVSATTPGGYTLTAGFVVNFTAGFTNGGAATLNVSGTGAVAINKTGPVPLTGGEITAGSFVSVIYTGTVYLIQSAQLGALATMNLGVWTKNDGSGNITLKNGLTLGDDGAGNLTVQPASITSAMLAPGAAALGRVMPQGATENLQLANDGTSPNFVVDIAAGRVRDDSDVTNLQLNAAMTKRLDQSWLGGTGNGGCDASTKGINQTWHAYLIGRTGMVPTSVSRTSNVASWTVNGHTLGVGSSVRITGQGGGFDGLQTVTAVTVNTFNYSNAGSNVGAASPAPTAVADGFDTLFSQSYPTPTFPAGWTVKQCLGSVLTDAAANIRAFHQHGSAFVWDTVGSDFNSTIATHTLVPILVPLGVRVKATVNLRTATSAADTELYISSPDSVAQVPSASAAPYASIQSAVSGAGASSISMSGQAQAWTDASAQVRLSPAASGLINCATIGWDDPRRRLF